MRSWLALPLLLTTPLLAQGGEISGHLDLHGPARSLTEASVTLRYVGSLGNTSSQEAQRTHPDAAGRFRFEDVRAGIYVLQVEGHGLLAAQWGSAAPGLAGRAVVLQAGQHLDDVVFPVHARPLLCGRILGPDGRAVSGAEVHAWRTDSRGEGMSMGGAAEDSMGGNTVADENGRYRFDTLAINFYVVGAYAPGAAGTMSSAPRPSGFWHDRAGGVTKVADHGEPIDLHASDAPDSCPYDITLRAPPPTYSGPRYSLAGRLAHGEVPATDRKLEWSVNPLSGDYRNMPVGHGNVAFDPVNPSFSFSELPPGRYRVTLAPPAPMWFSGPCTPFERVEGSAEIDLKGNRSGLVVHVDPAATIAGTIEEQHSVHDAPSKFRSPEHYYMGLHRTAAGSHYGGSCAAANAGADLGFSFSDLDPGEYTLSANLPVLGAYMASILQDGKPVTGETLHLHAGVNHVQVTERFDSGTVDATLTSLGELGSPAVEIHGQPLPGSGEVILLDQWGKIFPTHIGVGRGHFKGLLPPGRYAAIGATNEQLRWILFGSPWNAHTEELAKLAKPFEIRPGEITALTLPDHTVELQNLAAKLGLPMNRR